MHPPVRTFRVLLLRRALRSRLSEPMGVQIGGEIPPSTTTGPSDHRPPFVCSNSAHPPSILPCHPPFGWPFPPPSSAPGTSPDVSGRRAPLCSLPSSCIVGALNRGTPRRGKLLTPSSKVPGGSTDTAHQLLSNAPAFHTHRRLFPSTYSVVTPAHGHPLQLVTKGPMGSIGVYGR